MNERAVRKLMETEKVSDLWWSFSEGVKSTEAKSLLSVVEEFEGKVTKVQILHDSKKDQTDATWIDLDLGPLVPSSSPKVVGPVSSPGSSPQPAPAEAAPFNDPGRVSLPSAAPDGSSGTLVISPSQWLNAGLFALCLVAMLSGLVIIISTWSWFKGAHLILKLLILLTFFAIPAFAAFWRWLETKHFIYEIDLQRLKTHQGVLSKTHDTLELYRVKDTEITRPFWLRLIGRGNVILHTSDRTTPTLVLKAVEQPLVLLETLRERVEHLREIKRVREMDFSGEGDLL
ncbi:MAG: PH domain-containing protein [Puniceicoccaceae bacterium]